MSLIEKIQYIDRRFVFALMLIGSLAVTLYPIGLPVVTQEWVVKFYDTIESLEPNDNVFLSYSVGPTNIEAIEGSKTATKHLFAQSNVRIVMFATTAQTVPIMLNLIGLADPAAHGKVYGVDWINLGFIMGGETTLGSLSSDMKGLINVDHYGNSLDELPLWNELNDMGDFKLIIGLGLAEDADHLRRQIQSKYGNIMLHVGESMHLQARFHFYTSGLQAGMLYGMVDDAAYDKLTGFSSLALRQTDVLTALNFSVIFLILVGNLIYINQRRKSEMGG